VEKQQFMAVARCLLHQLHLPLEMLVEIMEAVALALYPMLQALLVALELVG
jgi:hypothetical protein